MNLFLVMGTVCGLLGALLIACKKYLEGQTVWLFANTFLFVHWFLFGNHWMMLLFGTYLALTIFAIINLRKPMKDVHHAAV